MRSTLIAGLLGLGLCTAATAQEAEAPAASEDETPPPPCSSEAYHQFDFWLGDWTVTATNGQFAGDNKITREEGGCLILERWTSVNGTTGQSYNYYNPARAKWHQVWVSPGVFIDYEGGLTERGSMRLEGLITYAATSTTAPFMGEWTPNPDGTVTQHFEQYNTENEEWAVWFTGLYTKQDDAAAED